MEDRLFQMLVHEKEISWRSLIYDLVKSQGMNPWDINITVLSQKYLARLKEIKEADLKVSGTVLLAAALLLKMKSHKLVGDDLLEFDRLFVAPQDESEFYDDLEQEYYDSRKKHRNVSDEKFPLYPRTPQPRKRKVSVFDLLNALEKAMEVKNRRTNRLDAVTMSLPEKKLDIGLLLKGLFSKITALFKKKESITFTDLLEKKSKEEMVHTFIPLLYLSNEQKVCLRQDEPFGEITITPPGEVIV